jgi:hypothetical protein
MSTTNLNLTTFNVGVTSDESFEDFRLDLDNVTDSNMTKIDAWSATIPVLLSTILNNTTASLVAPYNLITSSTASAITSACVVHSVETFFNKIGEFSGSGQADFNSLTQAYNHILILGQALGYTSGGSDTFYDVGIDFNGDSGSSNYLSVQWENSTIYSETIASYQNSQITISIIPASSTITYNAPGSIMAIIPYYSGSGGLYKCAMAFSANVLIPGSGSQVVATQGGVWINTSPITRIRIFPKTHRSLTPKRDFIGATKISLYGFI